MCGKLFKLKTNGTKKTHEIDFTKFSNSNSQFQSCARTRFSCKSMVRCFRISNTFAFVVKLTYFFPSAFIRLPITIFNKIHACYIIILNEFAYLWRILLLQQLYTIVKIKLILLLAVNVKNIRFFHVFEFDTICLVTNLDKIWDGFF